MERPSGARTPVPPSAPATPTMPATAPITAASTMPARPDVGCSRCHSCAARAQESPQSRRDPGTDASSPAVGRSSRLVHDAGSPGCARGLVFAGIYVPRISKTNAKAPDTSGVAAQILHPRARSSPLNRQPQMLRLAAWRLQVQPRSRPHPWPPRRRLTIRMPCSQRSRSNGAPRRKAT